VAELEPPENDKARRQALEIGARQVLPVSARSHTNAEFLSKNGGGRMGLFIAVALIIPAVLWWLLDEFEDLELVLTIAPYALAAVAVLGLILYFWPRRQIAYRNPWIDLEVGVDSFKVRDSAGEHVLDYSGMAFRLKRGPTGAFDGIALKSPLGILTLDNSRFKYGRIASAAIVKKCDDAGVSPQAAPVPPI
jgi:hypothetical protein